MTQNTEGVVKTENEVIGHGFTPEAYRFLMLMGEIEEKYLRKVINGVKFKMIYKSKYFKAACFIFILSAAIGALIINLLPGEKIVNYSETVIMDENYSYASYVSYKSALDNSEYVVYGTVKNIGEGYKFNIGEKYGYEAYEYYTPIEIEIKELIKGDYDENIITYHALGAIYEDVKYDYKAFNTFSLEKGDKIIVFLSERFQCISPDCIITEAEDGFALKADLERKDVFYSIDEYKKVIKEKYERMLTEK